MGVDRRSRRSIASTKFWFFATESGPRSFSRSLFTFSLSLNLSISLFLSFPFFFSVYLPVGVAEWILFVSHRYSQRGSVVVRPPKLSLSGRFMFPPPRESRLIPFSWETWALRVFFYTYAVELCMWGLRTRMMGTPLAFLFLLFPIF